MNKKNYLTLAALMLMLFLPASVSQAQEAAAPEKVMSLHDCMAFAIANSTKIRIQQAEIGDAQIARRNAILKAFTPNVSGNTYAYYNFGRSIDPETNTYVTETSFHNGYSLSAGITLFDGFNAVNNLKISKTSLAIGRTQEKQVEADICLAVMEAYYNVVYYKRLCDICEAQVTVAESGLQRLQRQEGLGQKSHADVVQAEADLADRRYDAINARNLYNDHLSKLSDLMFWPVEEELVISYEIGGDHFLVTPLSADEVVDYALAHNPGVKIAGWNLDNARRELMTARWQLQLFQLSRKGGHA